MLALDRQECQALCDLTTYCSAWTFSKDTNICGKKQREGWTVEDDSKFVSGLKGQGPFYQEDTNLVGGSYQCARG